MQHLLPDQNLFPIKVKLSFNSSASINRGVPAGFSRTLVDFSLNLLILTSVVVGVLGISRWSLQVPVTGSKLY